MMMFMFFWLFILPAVLLILVAHLYFSNIELKSTVDDIDKDLDQLWSIIVDPDDPGGGEENTTTIRDNVVIFPRKVS